MSEVNWLDLFLAVSSLTYRPVILVFVFKRSIQNAGCDSFVRWRSLVLDGINCTVAPPLTIMIRLPLRTRWGLQVMLFNPWLLLFDVLLAYLQQQ